jgi:glycosyltransferase involved in cell wall biosynthesis
MSKILFVCNDGYNTTNTRIRCYRFSDELRKSGIETEVFSFKDSLHARYDGFESYKSTPIERLTLLAKAVMRLAREDRSTVFYIQKSGYFAFAPLFVSLIKGNRIILDYDDYEYEQSPISRCMLRLLCKRAVFCVAASRYLLQFLKRFNRKVYFIPTGVDTKIFRPKKKVKADKQAVFAWVGFVVDSDAADNLLFILDSFDQMTKAKNEKTPRLEIVGGGMHLNEILGRIDMLRNKNIFYKGTLSPDLIPDYLDTVDIGLFILTKNTDYNKSKSPTKLFEYMAKGLAVISTNIGESGKIITDNGDGIIVRTQQEFIRKSGILARDRQLISRLGRNAVLSAAKNYSLDVLGKQLAEIIKKEISDE